MYCYRNIGFDMADFELFLRLFLFILYHIGYYIVRFDMPVSDIWKQKKMRTFITLLWSLIIQNTKKMLWYHSLFIFIVLVMACIFNTNIIRGPLKMYYAFTGKWSTEALWKNYYALTENVLLLLTPKIVSMVSRKMYYWQLENLLLTS